MARYFFGESHPLLSATMTTTSDDFSFFRAGDDANDAVEDASDNAGEEAAAGGEGTVKEALFIVAHVAE